MNDRIRQLQEQIEFEKRQIQNCKHEFGDAYSNPEIVSEPTGFRTVVQGSDIWSEATDYRDVQKPRWTRKCKKCGFEQHTKTTKPVIKEYVPDFRD